MTSRNETDNETPNTKDYHYNTICDILKECYVEHNLTIEESKAVLELYFLKCNLVLCDAAPKAWLIEDPDGDLTPSATTRPQEPDDTEMLIISELFLQLKEK